MVNWLLIVGIQLALWIGFPFLGFGEYPLAIGLVVSASVAAYLLNKYQTISRDLLARVQ